MCCCWIVSQPVADSGTSVGDQCTDYCPQREGLPVDEPVSRAGCQRETTGEDCPRGSPGTSGCSQTSVVVCP